MSNSPPKVEKAESGIIPPEAETDQTDLVQENEKGGMEGHPATQEQGLYETEIKEQDRWLPIANVARIMKTALPDNAKIAKEAKECMQECVSEFISFITSEASEKCQQEKRKTVNGEDILFAMTSLGFENYSEALKIYLARYRESNISKNEGGQLRSTGYGTSAQQEGISNPAIRRDTTSGIDEEADVNQMSASGAETDPSLVTEATTQPTFPGAQELDDGAPPFGFAGPVSTTNGGSAHY